METKLSKTFRLHPTCVVVEIMAPRGSHAAGCVKRDTGGGGEGVPNTE